MLGRARPARVWLLARARPCSTCCSSQRARGAHVGPHQAIEWPDLREATGRGAPALLSAADDPLGYGPDGCPTPRASGIADDASVAEKARAGARRPGVRQPLLRRRAAEPRPRPRGGPAVPSSAVGRQPADGPGPVGRDMAEADPLRVVADRDGHHLLPGGEVDGRDLVGAALGDHAVLCRRRSTVAQYGLEAGTSGPSWRVARSTTVA